MGVDVGPLTGFGDRSHQEATALLRQLRITYPAASTADGGVPRKFGISGMPTTVFLKSDGEIFRKFTGALSRNDLARITGNLLAAEAANGHDQDG